MLSNVIKSYLLNVVSLLCVGWVLYDVLNLNAQLSEIMKHPEPPWEATMSISSFASFIVLLIVIFFYYRVRKKTKNVSLLLFPLEFAEDDEREKMMTAEACKKAFVFLLFSFPIGGGLMTFYPLLSNSFSFYPVAVILLLLLVQLTVYYVSISKIYR
ncbi:MFS transporter [Priestia megaterium]|uniref:MFS transporter n=1 Tax=Priestia megaterium TaxID=1404 RepID=UPI002041E557|nr:MFS transporter [Priestia megaterium]MCM3193857.1 MFS transporter [Priestia megaterium]